MNKYFLLFLAFFCVSLSAEPLINLEKEFAGDLILFTKKIEIPKYPEAFNPSIVRWKGRLLLSFRIVPDSRFAFNSWIGLVWLNEEFQPTSEPVLLNLRENSLIPSRAEDGRLLTIGEKLYLVYSDCKDRTVTKGGFRLFVTELEDKRDSFVSVNPICLSNFDGADPTKREKNWVPFDYRGRLLLSYTISPHKVLFPNLQRGTCRTVSCVETPLSWPFGELRGGTPALCIGDEYLSFFHSSIEMASVHTEGKKVLHYFMGAYTFSAQPPFEVHKMSCCPLIAKGFYSGPHYKPYWKPSRVIFPGGILLESDTVLVTFGREDHEMWIVKFDRKKLMESLKTIKLSGSEFPFF